MNDNINENITITKSSREVAFEALCSVNLKGGYSNLTLDSVLKTNTDYIDKRDRAFASALFYGVIERKITLDYFIKKLSSMPFSKINPKCVILLEMGLYQIIFMNSIPDRAAVNETVELCNKLRLFSLKSFINGILRSFLRKYENFSVDNLKVLDFKDEYDFLSVKYSINYDLVKLISSQYGVKRTEAFLENSINKREIFLKINTIKISVEDFYEKLYNNNIDFEKCDFIPNCLIIKNQSSITEITGFKEGFFYVQDLASQICVKAIGAKKGDKIIDCCSAPGSKAFSMAVDMSNCGQILAFDLHKKRVDLINKSSKKLGIHIIKSAEKNAYIYDEKLNSSADIVVCDVPCSGLGTIGRKPEIKYKNLKEIENLYQIQEKILSNCAKYVKIMGKLVYSTCSVNKLENEDIIKNFLKMNDNFILNDISDDLKELSNNKGMINLFDNSINADGFFICKLKRIK